MSDNLKHDMHSDEMLVAFLDGQLSENEQQVMAELIEKDEVLALQLAFLAKGRGPFRDAFDLLLDEAPTERMAANLGSIALTQEHRPAFTRRGLVAAAIGLVAVGLVGGSGIGWTVGRVGSNASEGWRSAVAGYMSLYSTRTLTDLALDQASLRAQVANVSNALGVRLNLANIEMPGLEFRRAQILQFNGKPLAQLAYLDEHQQPFAFCVLAGSSGEAVMKTEEQRGMNLVFWSTATHSYLLVGRLSVQAMEQLAGKFRETLPA